MEEYTVWDLLDDAHRIDLREEAHRRIAEMPDAEKYFALGLLRFEEARDGQAGIERVIEWIATRKDA